jgi:hypothetical protein
MCRVALAGVLLGLAAARRWLSASSAAPSPPSPGLFDDDLEAVERRLDEVAHRADFMRTGDVIRMPKTAATGP